jgi:uncharacterized protein (TIGR02246 family)
MFRWLVLGSALLTAATAGPFRAGADTAQVADRAAIEAVLNSWPDDFNAENLGVVCDLFADDAVLLYPDSPPRSRDEFCRQIESRFGDPAKSFTYGKPDIHEVLVDGDLATVWLNWPLSVRDNEGTLLETVDENGVDVFRRQLDGSWKIHISHAFTQSATGQGGA